MIEKVRIKVVPGTGGFYGASSDGRVYSYRKAQFLTAFQWGRYLMVNVIFDGKRRRKKVHTLISIAWLGVRPNGLVVRHLNCDALDNRPQNLAYGTIRENYLDGVRNGIAAVGERCGTAKLTAAQVASIRKARADGTGYRALARQYGVADNTVLAIVTGRSWRSTLQ